MLWRLFFFLMRYRRRSINLHLGCFLIVLGRYQVIIRNLHIIFYHIQHFSHIGHIGRRGRGRRLILPCDIHLFLRDNIADPFVFLNDLILGTPFKPNEQNSQAHDQPHEDA